MFEYLFRKKQNKNNSKRIEKLEQQIKELTNKIKQNDKDIKNNEHGVRINSKTSENTINFKDYLKIKEAADLLGVTKNTLRNWERNKKISAYRSPQNYYRLYKKKDLEQLLNLKKNK